MFLGSCVSPCPDCFLLYGFNIHGALFMWWENGQQYGEASVVLIGLYPRGRQSIHILPIVLRLWLAFHASHVHPLDKPVCVGDRGILIVWACVTCPLLQAGIGRKSVIAIQPGGKVVPFVDKRCRTCKNRSHSLPIFYIMRNLYIIPWSS